MGQGQLGGFAQGNTNSPLRMMKLRILLLAAAALFSVPLASSAKEPRTPRPPRAPFQVPLQLLPVLAPTSTDATTDYYDITMQVGQREILSGRLTTIWGYNGLYPGPTIKATRGRTVVVRQLNNLQESMSVHLHGGHTPPESDGLPYDHDHAIDTTGRHAYMGLAGMYLIRDPAEDSLGLPSGKSDVALMIQDRLLNFDGSLNYPLDDTAISNGVFGNTLLVNEVVQPYFQVARRKMRFRIVNGSNARNYTLALSTGDSLVQIATDQGLLQAPASRSSIVV